MGTDYRERDRESRGETASDRMGRKDGREGNGEGE